MTQQDQNPFRVTSIKTRIETLINSFLVSIKSLLESLPLKQGLKLARSRKGVDYGIPFRVTSIKTRIETMCLGRVSAPPL